MWLKAASLFLLLVVACTSFSKFIVLLDFQLNNRYIAASLCENRNKPASCCHGKCFLKKQLQKEEAPGKSNSLPDKNEYQTLFCLQGSEMPALRGYAVSVLWPEFAENPCNSVLSPIFHPPGKI